MVRGNAGAGGSGGSGGGGGGTQRRKTKARNSDKFFLPRTKQQFQTFARRISFQFFNILFKFADSSLYLLGPLLIALASVIIGGLTYVYFRVILPMLAGSNWVSNHHDLELYWRNRGYTAAETTDEGGLEDGSVPISPMLSTMLALSSPTGLLHTIIVSFFLSNVIYNYYQCVRTSNSGPRYDSVVKELADVTGFHYPESDEELVQCKKDFERKIYKRMQKRRQEIMSERAKNNEGATAALAPSPAAASPKTPSTTTASPNTGNEWDIESQRMQSSPLMEASTTNLPVESATGPAVNTRPQPLPKIHNWQLLSPIEWGYCRYSSRPKPPRSHYDHVTKSLVLNMDHYCPWMFNVIGYFNYRYFFNFLWFVVFGLWYGMAICYRPFMNLGSRAYRDQLRAAPGWGEKQFKDLVVRHNETNSYIPTPAERTPVAMGFMLCLCLAAAVMCLGGFHLYLVLNALTTIEFHGTWSKRRKGWINPYSAGSWRRNWDMIYGTEQHRYGFWGILLAMMPSNREPEFLPLPIGGDLVRRKNRGVETANEDLEMAPTEETTGMHFLMD